MNIQNNLGYIEKKTFDKLIHQIKTKTKHADSILQLIADLIRFNTLISVARAGTGHLGASLSMIELLTEIYFCSFKFSPSNLESKDRDIFILSKGHGAPSLYATLAAKGFIKTEELDHLRRLNHLEGHCDISTPGIEANTGSLAMGLSKAVGYAITKKRFGLPGDVIVIVGDGELQEGQCWEAFISAASFRLDNLYTIIDDNKIQTDQYTSKIVQYGKLTDALQNIGFYIVEGNGKNVNEIHKKLQNLKSKSGKPKLFWCYTYKGQGVSYMENSSALKKSGDKYIWHNKAPDVFQLKTALQEIIERIQNNIRQYDFEIDIHRALTHIPLEPMQIGIEGKSLIEGFAQALLELGKRYKNIVVIDGDLEEDCGFIKFHKAFPTRFFEMGIMEQHMVATTCALSKLGYIPVISTYAAFLTSRANEQLYNLATEKIKALIVGNMSGIIPATPGKSHTGFRDIACVKNIPGITMYQPVSAEDTINVVRRYFREELGQILYLRLSIAPSAVELAVPDNKLKRGISQVMRKGIHILVIGIGPVVLGECMEAAENLAGKGIEIELWNNPWLLEFNYKQLKTAAERKIPLLIVEDHYVKGGFGESLLSFLSVNNINFIKISHLGLTGFPQTGFRDEVLQSSGLGSTVLSSKIISLLSQ